MLTSFKYQLYIGSALILILSLSIMSLSVIHITEKTIRTNSIKYFNLALVQTNKNLDTTLGLAQDSTNNLLRDEFLQKNLVEANNGNHLDVLQVKELRESMNNVFRDSSLIQYVEIETLYDQNINTGLCSNKLINDELRAEADKLNGRTYWFITEEKVCNSYDSQSIIGVRKILDYQKLNEHLGYLVFTIDAKFFNRILNLNNDLKEMNILIRQEGKVFTNELEKSHANKNSPLLNTDWEYILDRLQNENAIQLNEHLFFSEQSEYTGWSLIGVIPKNQITNGLDKIILVTLTVILSLIAINLFLISKFSTFISRPIQEIINKMNLVSSGNFNTQYEKKKFYNKETEQLARNFNLMVSNIRYLVKENYEKENKEKRAEIRALQAQVNPHFLYNTLDNIFWGLESESKSEVSELILSLSKILRYALDRKSEVTFLGEELKYIDQYLFIMSYRFHGRFTIERQIPNSLLNCAIPRLVIQPLIENAIVHGLEPKKTHGILKLSGELIGGKIHLYIWDNGIGMTKEQIDAIFLADERSDLKGLGILNVHNRIRLHYGDSYGVKIESRLNVGTKITLTFPHSSFLFHS